MLSYYEYDNKQKKIILFLKFTFNTDLGPKKFLHDQQMTTSCCKTSQKCKYTSSAFRGKKVKIMHAMTNYAKKFCQHNLSKPGSRRFELMSAEERGAFYLQAPV